MRKRYCDSQASRMTSETESESNCTIESTVYLFRFHFLVQRNGISCGSGLSLSSFFLSLSLSLSLRLFSPQAVVSNDQSVQPRTIFSNPFSWEICHTWYLASRSAT